MLFYGMSSESAMTRHVGGVARNTALRKAKPLSCLCAGPVENTA